MKPRSSAPDHSATTAARPARRHKTWLALLFAAAVVALVAWLLHRELAHYRWTEVRAHLTSLRPSTLAFALLFTATSYGLLTCYDLLALRYVGKRVAWRHLAATSFIAYALNHNIGFSAFTGSAVRYRFYTRLGLTARNVAMVAAFCALTTLLALTGVAGIALLAAPPPSVPHLLLGRTSGALLGAALTAVPVAYLLWSALSQRPLQVGRHVLRTPAASIALPQFAVAVCELSAAACVLWVLLPADAHIPPLAFAGLYAVGVVAGIVSTVPGGLGVFELVLLSGMPGVPQDELLGALLAYRIIYYLVPLGVAGLVLGWWELHGQRHRLANLVARAQLLLAPVAPVVGAALAFLAGIVLLISGVTPAIDERLRALKHVVPLPLLELSHLAGSVTGLLLLVLARALLRRSAAAWQLTLWLLAIGILASLVKGLDVEEAGLLGAVALVLWLGRASFYRRSSLTQERLSRGWVLSVVGVVALSLLVGWLANDVRYNDSLFWTFGHSANASRSLRASVVVVALLLALMLGNLLRPARAAAHDPGELDLDRARRAMELSAETLCNAALTGDKRLQFADDSDAFIMYQVSGRSWVALGDPVGPRPAQRRLAQQFATAADRAGAWPVFYQVSAANLAMYVDLGLALTKLGEEARVDLGGFNLEGSARADLRQTHRRAQRSGMSFRIIAPADVPRQLPVLRAISDSWLAGKSVAEKGFSVGAWSEEYVQKFPVALVLVEGAPVAFANLWTTRSREELSVDLMRFAADAPRNAMDYLFIELMLWGRSEGYRWFNLGMAPLAGLDPHALAPAWHKLGSFIFRHGEHFYNFEGLKHYKEKFAPEWLPRYLAAPGTLILPWVLLDVSRLISGGLKGLVKR